MFTLISDLSDSVTFGGQRIRIDLSYDKVLAAYDIMESKNIRAEMKVVSALKLFVDTPLSLGVASRAELVALIFKKIAGFSQNIDCYNYGDNEGHSDKSLNYSKDASAIYAAFMQAYGIDLYDMQGKLHWVKFLMLLNNIPDAWIMAFTVRFPI